MSSEHVEIVRRIFEAFNAREFEFQYGVYHPEIEWHQDPNAVEPGSYYGHEGVRRWHKSLFEGFDDVRIDIDRIVGAGEHVVALYRIHARGKGSGLEGDRESASLFTFEADKVVRHEVFLDTEKALAAAGIAGPV